jgi:hypothetical protein
VGADDVAERQRRPLDLSCQKHLAVCVQCYAVYTEQTKASWRFVVTVPLPIVDETPMQISRDWDSFSESHFQLAEMGYQVLGPAAVRGLTRAIFCD